MMQALELLRLAKRYSISPDEVMLNNEEIKSVALAIIELCLSEGISQSVTVSHSQSQSVTLSHTQSVEHSVK